MNPSQTNNQELEQRIATLEQNLIAVNMSQNADKNVLRSVQRALAIGNTLSFGSAATTKSALLELVSITKGLVVSRMTETQRDLIVNPTAGLIIYNTTSNKLNVYTTAWEAITSV